jgi:hypothetical protein
MARSRTGRRPLGPTSVGVPCSYRVPTSRGAVAIASLPC